MAHADTANRLHRALTESGRTLATAESCTGGLIAARLTDISGASAYFQGGVVTYSNALKRLLLDVAEATLLEHGAVSAETAREMAEGARRQLRVDWSVAATGIAGPNSDGTAKPVGLVFIAVAGPGGSTVRQLNLSGDRDAIRRQTVDAAIEFLMEHFET